MNSVRPLVIAVSLILSGQMASAQDMSRYRVYALESSLDSVIAASGARASRCEDAPRTAGDHSRAAMARAVSSVPETRWPIRCARSHSRSTTTRYIRSSSTTIATARKA